MPRPEGQRCLVISANGVTLSRQRNGRILHSFPSALPNGARTKEVAAGSHVYCILDCIFHAVQLKSSQQPNVLLGFSECLSILDILCFTGEFREAGGVHRTNNLL